MNKTATLALVSTALTAMVQAATDALNSLTATQPAALAAIQADITDLQNKLAQRQTDLSTLAAKQPSDLAAAQALVAQRTNEQADVLAQLQQIIPDDPVAAVADPAAAAAPTPAAAA